MIIGKINIFGGTGIVGKSLATRMKALNFEVKTFGRSEMDFSLKRNIASHSLPSISEESQILVFAAGTFPVRDHSTLKENTTLAENFCESFRSWQSSKVIYVSSDAVYSPSSHPISESSEINSEGFHARCHVIREEIFKSHFSKEQLLVLRPVALFGPNDSHNSYGPNAFARSIRDNKPIELWGEGSELRDHLYEEDFAKFVTALIQKGSYGEFNIASGNLYSFRRIAETLIDLSGRSKEIVFRARRGNAVIEETRRISTDKFVSEIGSHEPSSLEQGLKSLLP